MSGENRALLAAFAVLSACVLAIAGRNLDEPGLYYDEVIQATPAAEFLREGGEPLAIPGAKNTWLLGGWFPLMTQPYMGALKSQLLIPVFAVFGASQASLRLTTLVWGCAGLLLAMLWLRAVFGLRVAVLTGALLAVDPSFLFVSRHDWGSTTLALVCRGGGLWLLTTGWQRDSTARLAVGGLLLGLGVYNKIDFLPFLAGSGLALLASAPREFWRRLRMRPGAGIAAAAGLALGAAPMGLTLKGVFSATGAVFRSTTVRGGDLAEKLQTWSTMLDGSYFHRLMRAGGSFERLAEVDGAAGPFLWVFAASFAGLGAWLWRDARRGHPSRAQLFAWLATLLVALGLLATPRAARIHHTLNAYPLPQLVVALAVARLWQARPRGLPPWAPRAVALAGLAASLLGSLRVDVSILRTLRETGGSGRWSGALAEFALELPADAAVVSLDWGFHAPLRFVRPELDLSEPVWILAFHPRPEGFTLPGGPRHVYLIHTPDYQVFPLGASLLDAVAALPQGSATVRDHLDRTGRPAFRSIRFARPHELVYRGSFEVRLR